MTESVDCVVVGAGVVGLAVARALAQAGREVLVLERAAAIGSETSSRNSEVIHAGIYYRPGSLKAKLCLRGRELLYDYCMSRGLAHRRCGKLIVAAEEAEEGKLAALAAAARENGVDDLRPLSGADIGRLEPAVRATSGLFSPSTGIIDSHGYMQSLEGDLSLAGGTVVLRTSVIGGEVRDRGIVIRTGGSEPMELLARSAVNAAGLWAQDLALTFDNMPPSAVPRRHLAIGHYYTLTGPSPFSHLVYPVPEDGGIGVHVTLDLAGGTRFGPDVRWIEDLTYDFDDQRRDDFIASIRRYYPGLNSDRLQPGYTGVRPKLVGSGGGFADFRIDGPEVHGIHGLINLFGIESPGLTASLALGELVAGRLRASRAA